MTDTEDFPVGNIIPLRMDDGIIQKRESRERKTSMNNEKGTKTLKEV